MAVVPWLSNLNYWPDGVEWEESDSCYHASKNNLVVYQNNYWEEEVVAEEVRAYGALPLCYLSLDALPSSYEHCVVVAIKEDEGASDDDGSGTDWHWTLPPHLNLIRWDWAVPSPVQCYWGSMLMDYLYIVMDLSMGVV